MEEKTIKNIFEFLEKEEKKRIPRRLDFLIKRLKLIDELENHPDDTQYRYRGILDLANSSIKKLPNNLYVDYYLILKNCKQLTELPNKLYVGSYLDLEYSGIKSLPEGLKVDGDLYLDNTNIKFLPKGLKVENTLVLGYSSYLLNFSDEELMKMIDPNENGEGYINGEIERRE
jgi:hypothetical protein